MFKVTRKMAFIHQHCSDIEFRLHYLVWYWILAELSTGFHCNKFDTPSIFFAHAHQQEIISEMLWKSSFADK